MISKKVVISSVLLVVTILFSGLAGFFTGHNIGFKAGQLHEIETSWKKDRSDGPDFYLGGDWRGWDNSLLSFFYKLENAVYQKLQHRLNGKPFSGSWAFRHGVDKKSKGMVILVIVSQDESLVSAFFDRKIKLVEVIYMNEIIERIEERRRSGGIWDDSVEIKELTPKITERILKIAD